MSYNITRFLDAQIFDYDTALSEIKSGHKQTHWMWYIFPQLKELGRSSIAKYYGIANLDEAREYLNHPVLFARLKEISEALLSNGKSDPYAVMGSIDGKKLCASMTLFAEIVGYDSVFEEVLKKYYNGKKDEKTIRLLNGRDEDE